MDQVLIAIHLLSKHVWSTYYESPHTKSGEFKILKINKIKGPTILKPESSTLRVISSSLPLEPFNAYHLQEILPDTLALPNYQGLGFDQITPFPHQPEGLFVERVNDSLGHFCVVDICGSIFVVSPSGKGGLII